MHEIRSSLVRGERRTPLASKGRTARPVNAGASLCGIQVRREEARRCDQRREGRCPGIVDQAVITHRRRSYEVAVLNVSSRGAMIEAARTVDAGAEVELDLSEGVRLAGEVRWSQEGRIGLRFAEAFDLQRLGAPSRTASLGLLKPDYLQSELLPDSPWAGRRERLTIKDVKRR